MSQQQLVPAEQGPSSQFFPYGVNEPEPGADGSDAGGVDFGGDGDGAVSLHRC
jgi:hypothetical protein